MLMSVASLQASYKAGRPPCGVSGVQCLSSAFWQHGTGPAAATVWRLQQGLGLSLGPSESWQHATRAADLRLPCSTMCFPSKDSSRVAADVVGFCIFHWQKHLTTAVRTCQELVGNTMWSLGNSRSSMHQTEMLSSCCAGHALGYFPEQSPVHDHRPGSSLTDIENPGGRQGWCRRPDGSQHAQCPTGCHTCMPRGLCQHEAGPVHEPRMVQTVLLTKCW